MPPTGASSKPNLPGHDCLGFGDKKEGFLVPVCPGQVRSPRPLVFRRANSYRFVSVASGAPLLLREADVSAEYPKDVDDENITHQGLLPTLPGELTKLSSALALFKASRILGKALEALYPASTTYQLSLKKLHVLSDELDQWSQDLPSHLRLQFSNDKPSTAVISCRSPLLVCHTSFASGSPKAFSTDLACSPLPISSLAVSSTAPWSAMGLEVVHLQQSWLSPIPPSTSCRY
jgi:hypothetical protein